MNYPTKAAAPARTAPKPTEPRRIKPVSEVQHTHPWYDPDAGNAENLRACTAYRNAQQPGPRKVEPEQLIDI